MSWPTTRRYPRTLQQAFPHEARHAYAIERVSSRRMESVGGWLVVIALVVTIAFAVVA